MSVITDVLVNNVISTETETQTLVLSANTLIGWGMQSGTKLRQALVFLQKAQNQGKFKTKTEAHKYWKDFFY